MRRFWLLLASAGLNIALVVALLLPRPHSAPEAAKTEQAPPPAGESRVKTQVVVRKQFFSWIEVESPEYPVYIARLREIGCPEQTIRDIVVADVNQLYARKRLTDVATPEQQWWRSEPDTNLVQAASVKLQALDLERRALLSALLGPNWEVVNPESLVVTLNGPVLGELSNPAQRSVQEVLARAQQRVQTYLDSQQKDGKPADAAQLGRFEQETRGELAKLLTPAQLEEFLLRFSRSADTLRKQLSGFPVTPDEFRNLFRLRDPIIQQLSLIAGSDSASLARRNGLEKQLDDAFKTVLGAERYQAYHLSQDQALRDAVALGEQTGASAAATRGLYRINQYVRQEQDRIRNDPNLTPEQKEEQLKSIEQQQKQVSDELLGRAQTSPPPVPPAPTPFQVHSFSPGETVDQLAARYGVTPVSIVNANSNLDLNKLQRGTPIRIPQKQ